LLKRFLFVFGPALEAVSSDLNEHLILLKYTFAIYDPYDCSRVWDYDRGFFLEVLVHAELHAVDYRRYHGLLFDLKFGQRGILQHALKLLSKKESL